MSMTNGGIELKVGVETWAHRNSGRKAPRLPHVIDIRPSSEEGVHAQVREATRCWLEVPAHAAYIEDNFKSAVRQWNQVDR
jgi:hypothetical protein